MNGGTYGGEAKRVDLYSQCGDVFLLELAGQMALNEGGLLQRFRQISHSPIQVATVVKRSKDEGYGSQRHSVCQPGFY